MTTHRLGPGARSRRAAAVTALALLPFACSNAANEPATPSTPPGNAGVGDIVFIARPDFSVGGSIQDAVDDWNRKPEHEKQQVKVVAAASSADAGRSQLVAVAQDAAHGGRDCYDVMALDVIWTAEFAQFGYIMPLDRGELDIDSHIDRTVDTVEFGSMAWAVPFATDVGLLYYRKDILRAAPPKTWAELVGQARTIARQHGMSGYVGQFAAYEGLTVNALELIRDHGGDLLAGDGGVVTEGSAVEAALSDLRDGMRISPGQWISSDALTYQEEDSRRAFEQGKALFMRNWPYAYAVLTREDSALDASQVGVAPLPWNSVLGGQNLAVASCSPYQKTARDFIKYMTSLETQRQLFLGGGNPPTRAEVYADPEARNKYPYIDLVDVVDEIRTAEPRPKDPHYGLESRIIQTLLTDFLTSNLTPEDALTPGYTVAKLERRLADTRRGR